MSEITHLAASQLWSQQKYQLIVFIVQAMNKTGIM